MEKPHGSPARVLSNEIAPGAWMPLGHAATPPAVTQKFGPPRFTPEQQAANPTLPMTRLVKDVLRVGKWKVGIDPNNGQPILWDVTPHTLAGIVGNFSTTQSRGIAMNLTKSHGNLQTGVVPTDDLISPLDACVVDGDVMWLATYATPEQAKVLTNPAVKVSPMVWPNWVDGMGNKYPGDTLLHVAATDQPVVSGQGPFVALANSQSKGAGKMDLEEIRGLVNQILSAAGGPQIPEGVDETSFLVALKMAASMLSGEEPEAEEAPEGDGGGEMADAVGAALGAGAAMNNSGTGSPPPGRSAALTGMPPWAKAMFGEFSTQIKALSNQVNQGVGAQRKTEYDAKLAALATAGKITPAQRAHLEKAGPSVGYALSNLAVFDLNANTPQQQSGGKAAKALANAAAPAVGGDGGAARMSSEEHAESLKKRGLQPVEMK